MHPSLQSKSNSMTDKVISAVAGSKRNAEQAAAKALLEKLEAS